MSDQSTPRRRRRYEPPRMEDSRQPVMDIYAAATSTSSSRLIANMTSSKTSQAQQKLAKTSIFFINLFG